MLSKMCLGVDVHPVLDSGPCVLVGWGCGVRHRHCEAITACNRRWRRWTAVGVRRTDALPGPRGGAGGDGTGPGVGVDGTARGRRVRDEPATARRAAGRRGIDDAVGAADGERGGVDVLLRGGGPAAGGVGGGQLRGEADRARDAGGGRGCGGAARDGAVGAISVASAVGGRPSAVGRDRAPTRKMLKEG